MLDGFATSHQSDGFTSTPAPPYPPPPPAESTRTKPVTEPVLLGLLGLLRGLVGPEEQLAATTHDIIATMIAPRPSPRARPGADPTGETAIAPSRKLRSPQ
jgi:hypothetical protein